MTVKPFSVIFLAGGTGTRIGSHLPKQYLPIHQKPLALYSFEIFASLPEVKEFIIVCEEKYENFFKNKTKNLNINLQFARPGQRRQDSVWNGMQLLKEESLVCIHDSARPLITQKMVYQVIEAAEQWQAAVLGVKVRATIKLCDEEQLIKQTPNRAFLWEMQTPQVIRLSLLKAGFEYARQHDLTVTDDVSLVEILGKPVKVVEGSYANIKVTTPEDLIFTEQLIKNHVLL